VAIWVVSGATSRRQLGRELRKARTEARLTQSAIAAVLGCGQGKINKIETTLVAVSRAELEKMLEAYRVPADKAADLRRLAVQDRMRRRRNGVQSSPAFEQLSDRESDATEVLCWHSERIPGPLQSEHYMYQQFNTNSDSLDVVQLARRRLARTHLFTVDDPPHYQVILSESSMHRMPGGRSPELVVDQAEHLLTCVKNYPRLSLRILTFDAPVPCVDSDFVLLRFDGDDDFAYIEYPGGARIFTRPRELAMFEDHWRELRDAALGTEESIQFLEHLAEVRRAEWRKTYDD
jgi:transcriptional regulator with XRE-family HTH domain